MVIQAEDSQVEHKTISGRRIFDVNYLFEQIAGINHGAFGCSFKDLIFFGETRKGLQSNFKFQCKICGLTETINNDKLDVDLNQTVVQAVVGSGSGFAQLDEFCSHLNIPCMSDKTFMRQNMILGDVLKDVALESMYQAGLEEKELAIKNGHVDKDGVPYITVVADASWGKRSYRTSNYNSLSGVACIIGFETQKVLFLGIRNSYCSVCAVAQNKHVNAKAHKCFKNWEGTSTAMEADGVTEGFKCSIDMHGLKYTTLIGDGDSSVMSALNDAQPYGHLTTIKKVECSNHLLRNYCTKLRSLTKKTENKHGPVPILLRKRLDSNILRLQKAIKGAVDYSSKMTDKTMSEKVNSLKEDLLNGPCHIFGDHSNCKVYYCKGPKPGEENYVTQLKDCGLWYDIYSTINTILNNAESLLLSKNNNTVEQFNALIAKFIGGKRINYALRGSYESRCYAAAITRNTGNLMDSLQKASGVVDNIYTQKYQSRKLKRRLSRQEKSEKKSKRQKIVARPDESYGDVEKEPDLDEDELEKKRKLF